jgi:hypothetical protein
MECFECALRYQFSLPRLNSSIPGISGQRGHYRLTIPLIKSQRFLKRCLISTRKQAEKGDVDQCCCHQLAA